MRLCRHVPSVDEVVPSIAAILKVHDVAPACVVGHSFGTLIASRLLQLHPGRVSSLALLDPVCFLIFSGHLLKYFVYQAPRWVLLLVRPGAWLAGWLAVHCVEKWALRRGCGCGCSNGKAGATCLWQCKFCFHITLTNFSLAII